MAVPVDVETPPVPSEPVAPLHQDPDPPPRRARRESAEEENFDWTEIPQQPIHDPWAGRNAPDPIWPGPDELDDEPLPENQEETRKELGKVLASLRLFEKERTNFITWGYLTLTLFVGLACLPVLHFFTAAAQNRTTTYEMQDVVTYCLAMFASLGISLIFLTVGYRYKTVQLWLCRRGIAWMQKGKFDSATWIDVREVNVDSKRVNHVYGERIVAKEETHRYSLICRGLNDRMHVEFSTNNTALAKPFMDVLSYEVYQGRLPIELERLNQGKRLHFDMFEIGPEGVTHEDEGLLPWSQLTGVEVIKGELLLYGANRKCWVSVQLGELSFAPLVIKLIETGMAAHRAKQRNQP